MRNLLILSPLPLETKALVTYLRQLGLESQSSHLGPIKMHGFPELGWQFATAGHGKVQFGIQTQYLIAKLPEVEAILCAGCAGALSDDLDRFDVILAVKTIEHDYRLRFAKGPNPEFAGDEKLLARFKNLTPQGYRMHLGSIASGDEDVVEATRVQEIRAQTGAMAVAWEGAGGARACKFNAIPFLEVRGITDKANSVASADFVAHLGPAMSNVCEALLAAFR